MKTTFAAKARLFKGNKGGVSAIEFALIFPIMMVLLLGTVSIGQAIAIQRKITLFSRSAADMTAQLPAQTTGPEVGLLQYAARLYITPYDVRPSTVIISSIWKADDGRTTVDWSYGDKGGRVWGSAFTMPASEPLDRNNSVILAEVSYDYKVPFGQNIFGESIQLSSKTFMKPRNTNRITIE